MKNKNRIPKSFEGMGPIFTTKRFFGLYKVVTCYQDDHPISPYHTILYYRKKSIQQLPSSTGLSASDCHYILDRLAWLKMTSFKFAIVYTLFAPCIIGLEVFHILYNVETVKANYVLMVNTFNCGFTLSFLIFYLTIRSDLFKRMTDKILSFR